MDILDIRRSKLPHGIMTRYEYRFGSSDVDSVGSAIQEFTADVNQTVVENFCGEIAELVQHAQDGYEWSSIGPRLQRVGNRLYKLLFPLQQGYLPELAQRLRASTGLLLRTNEAVIPWETLHDDDEFFGLKYDFGRQYVVRQPVLKGREIGPIRRVLFVADGLGDLPSAAVEARTLAESLGEHKIECTVLSGADTAVSAVVEELANGEYDLLHFSGHVQVIENTTEAALVLHGGELLDHDTIEALLAGVAPPVVFINGCASAEPLSNLCSSFMKTGSKVVIGLLYEVPDRIALDVARSFYDRLINRKQPAGAALRESRRSAHKRNAGVWTSFVLYGNPWASVGVLEEPDPAPTIVSEVDSRPKPLGADAQQLLNRAKEFAASRGTVTSMDLLVQLLKVDERMRSNLGPQNAAVIEQLVVDLLELMGGVPAEGDVPLSDTVTRVVAFAAELAAGTDCAEVSVEHIAEAFVRVGGGTSTLVLKSLNIDLESLRSAPTQALDLPQTNGTGSGPARPRRGRTGGSPVVTDTGELRSDRFAAETLSALATARILARMQGEVTGSYLVLLGFMLAGSDVLRRALLAQGAAGQRLVRRFYPGGRRLTERDFSTRIVNSLTRALDAASGTGPAVLGDAEVLAEVLAEDGSSARDLLTGVGIDSAQLERALREAAAPHREPRGDGVPEPGSTSAGPNGAGTDGAGPDRAGPDGAGPGEADSPDGD